jgi:hypothetical protein
MADEKPASKRAASLVDLHQNGIRADTILEMQLSPQTCILGRRENSIADCSIAVSPGVQQLFRRAGCVTDVLQLGVRATA